jgi:hypothetical protein
MRRPTLPGCGKDDVFIRNMISLNGIMPFEGKLLKPCRLGPKQKISYYLGLGVTYGIRVIAQPKMGRACTSPCWVLRGGNCDVLHCLNVEDDVFI